LTWLAKKTHSALTQTAQSDLKRPLSQFYVKLFFKKVDTPNLQHPRHDIKPKKLGVKSHACVPLKFTLQFLCKIFIGSDIVEIKKNDAQNITFGFSH